MLLIFNVLIGIIHTKRPIRLTITLLCLLSWIGAASAESDGLRPFATYGRIELEEDARIVDFPVLSISEGDLSDFCLEVGYNGKQVEILGITTPVAETRLAYDFTDKTLHFDWTRTSAIAIGKGDTLAILHVFLKHKPTNNIDRYFRIYSDGQHVKHPDKYLEEWQVALPKIGLYYYETDEEEDATEGMIAPLPQNADSDREIALKEQGGRTSEVRIMSVIPNPMKTWADITYAVEHDCVVSLKLYSLMGEEVATIVNARRNAGLYRHNITPPASAGVYVLRLSTVRGNTMDSDIMKVIVHNN